MKTVDNDELSNLVLKGELTQEEALSMTDDKEQLLRMIKNKRWTHYYLRALIYQKHALNLLIENRAYWNGMQKKIKDITNTKNSLQALLDDYKKDYERIAEKQASYNRLKGMAKGKTHWMPWPAQRQRQEDGIMTRSADGTNSSITSRLRQALLIFQKCQYRKKSTK